MAQLVKNPSAIHLDSIPGSGRFPWRRERLPTPVFRPGESHGLHSPWGLKESDMTEQLSTHSTHLVFPDSSFGKDLPAMQETPVQFLRQEDPLKKGKATHSRILAWRIPWAL